MLICVALLPLALVSVIFYRISYGQNSSCWRSSILSASILWGVLLTAITEFLSIFNSITPAWILGLWGLSSIISLYVCIRVINKAKPVVWFKISETLYPVIPLLFGIVSIAILLVIIALVAPPNNCDSMIYHMCRVIHWIQDKNVGHYPTHIIRQLYLQPWAEFAIMHFQILSGGDRFANLVQWFSMIGSLLGVSLIVKHFGANVRTQIFAAVIAVTIPMGILQASSTQNDYVASFWMVCYAYFIMRLIKEPNSLNYLIATGSSLGLALLTKGTCYLFALPFLIWLGFSGFKKIKIKILSRFLVITALALLINSGYFVRNFELFHNFFGSKSQIQEYKEYSNSAITLPIITSNIIRNIGLHLGTRFQPINNMLTKVIYAIHKYLNINIRDPRSTFYSLSFGVYGCIHEDGTGNFIHLFLIIISIAVFLMKYSKTKERDLLFYGMAVMGGFIVFCTYLKWQPWHSRLHLPIFILWSPFIAITLSKVCNQCKQNKKMLLFIWSIVLCVSIGSVLYASFGHKLIAAMYEGKSTGFLNGLIMGRTMLPLGHYFKIADKTFWLILGTTVCFLLSLALSYRYHWRFTNIICIILFLASSTWVFHNQTRKMFGARNIFSVSRIDQYFCGAAFKDSYIGAVDYVKSKGCSNIGIIFTGDDWEYPFFVLLRKSYPQGFRIEYVNVNNISSVKYNIHPFDSFDPCAIISVGFPGNEVVNKNVVYVKNWSSDTVSVFIKK